MAKPFHFGSSASSGSGVSGSSLGEILRNIAQGISTATGAAFFLSLVEQLAHTLDVEYAFVGEVSADGSEVQTTAVFGGGRWLDNFSYRLEGTPCAEILSHKACCYPSGVWRLFPEDGWLVREKIESYLGVPLLDSAGQPLGLLAVLDRKPFAQAETIEATLRIYAARAVAELERKRVEDALRRSEEWSRRIVESVPGGIVIVRADGAILQANPEGVRILGLSREQLLKRSINDFADATINDDGSPCPVEDYPEHKCFRTGLPQPGQTIGVRRPDGEVSWAVYSAVPLQEGSDGKPAVVLVTFFDITERKRNEERLQKSEEFHRLISEIASDYAYSCRIEPDGRFRLDALTEGFPRVTGYTLEQIEKAGGWPKLIHPDDLPETLDRTRSLLLGQAGEGEVRILTKSGKTRWIHYTTRPFWNAREQRVDRFVGAVQDITERKQSEQRLQSLSRRLLEVQEQERQHLARELHDEVGQILTGIKIALESAGQPGKVEPFLTQAQNMVRELTRLVRDLSLGLRPSMLDDLGLLPALLWLVERLRKQTGLAVRLAHRDLEGRFPVPVEIAAFRIIQEALTNVVRHSGAHAANVNLWIEHGNLLVQVIDQGQGFERRKWSGNKGGLSGMQERATLLGGRLQIESHPREGTCVTAELPIGPARSQA